jgi:hypothetical protein
VRSVDDVVAVHGIVEVEPVRWKTMLSRRMA